MFCSKIFMELLPNIHLLGALTMTYTVVFRLKALIPIYIYVMMNGAYAGFSPWWMPYLYIWTILWGVTMLLPKKMSELTASIVYPIVCALHGFLFGLLYLPADVIMWDLEGMEILAYYLRGISFDLIHGVGNIFAGLLVLPLSTLLKKLMKRQWS